MNKIHLQKILKNRIDGIGLDENQVFPYYEGFSNFNIPSSLCQFFDIPSLEAKPINPDVTGSLRKNYKNVIVILVDALSAFLLEKWMEKDKGLVWNDLEDGAVNSVLTSIVPSTTSTVISSLWTGASPAAHGVLGYELWLKEYGIVANMIEHKPISYKGRSGNLSNAGFDPENLLFGKSIATHFKEYGISSHAFQHYSIINSGMSQSFMQDAHLHPVGPISDMWISVRELMEEKKNDKKFIYTYWSAVDSLSHFHGPNSERVFAEFKLFSSAFQQLFLNELSEDAKKDTLIIMTADHGQITTDKFNEDLNLNNHPEFLDLLTIKPTGENRLPYLFIKPNQIDDVKNYIEKKWPSNFSCIDPLDAVKKGLFGPGDIHKKTLDRLGDLIVIPHEDAYWWWSENENPLIGRHGGFSDKEMIVPFFAFEAK